MQEENRSLYQYVIHLLIDERVPFNDIVKILIDEKCLSEKEALSIVNDVFNRIKERDKKNAQKTMTIGAIIGLFGILLVLLGIIFSPELLNKKRTFFIYGGAIIIGGVQFFRGLILFSENKSLTIENFVIKGTSETVINSHTEENNIDDCEIDELDSEQTWEDIAKCKNNIVPPPHGSFDYCCPQCENEAIWIHYKSSDLKNENYMAICPKCEIQLHSQPIK
ncbi:hypothetical protein [Dysgonomonas sp. 520]|uniref:hypothetical protein n=1 Tax=Dysgonomonas sp. 520 TaxID=2302931 RepID=UPI0013D72155|nr:hypothetical protein [Dysgonomonas sp. 520]NDW09320.1 hypothetical protein [Dysgonomonas sp. 520]